MPEEPNDSDFGLLPVMRSSTRWNSLLVPGRMIEPANLLDVVHHLENRVDDGIDLLFVAQEQIVRKPDGLLIGRALGRRANSETTARRITDLASVSGIVDAQPFIVVALIGMLSLGKTNLRPLRRGLLLG